MLVGVSVTSAQPRPKGWVTNVSPLTSDCPAGFSCVQATVGCPEIAPLGVNIAVATPSNTRGVGVFLSGNAGTRWYSDLTAEVPVWFANLRTQGLRIVQVRWKAGWWTTSGGLDSGSARIGCRPATVLKYIHDTYYLPLGFGRRSFITTGNSAGSSAIAYSLAFYGADSFIDAAILTAGPPHAALQKSCMNVLSESKYWLQPAKRAMVDNSYGILLTTGPCRTSNGSWIPRWKLDSIAYGGNDFLHSATRVSFIIGAGDPSMAAIASDYRQKLQLTGSPYVSWTLLPNTGHEVFATVEGRNAISAAALYLLQSRMSGSDDPILTERQ